MKAHRRLPRQARGAAATLLLAAALGACDAFFVEPAPPVAPTLSVALTLAATQEPLPRQLLERVFAEVDRARVRVSDGATTLLDAEVPVEPVPGGLATDVIEFVVGREAETVDVVAHLLDDSLPVFSGTARVDVSSGGETDVTIAVELLDVILGPGESCADYPPYATYAQVTFDDAVLEGVVRSRLELGPSRSPSCEEVGAMVTLDATRAGIVRLGGIQNLTGLRDLTLAENTVTDLSPLQALTALQRLDLRSNPIRDIAPLLVNPGLGYGDVIDLRATEAACPDVFALAGTGADVDSNCQLELLGYWSFDACDARDDSGRGSPGTISGGPSCVPGARGQALEYDGVDDWVATTLSSNRQPLAISVWFRPHVVRGERSIVDGDVSSEYGQSLIHGYTNGDATLDVQYHDDYFDSGLELEADTWYHAVGVWEPGKVSLYVDGRFIGSETHEQGELNGDFFRFGRHNEGDPQWFDGVIDEVRIFGVAGTPAAPPAVGSGAARR